MDMDKAIARVALLGLVADIIERVVYWFIGG